MTVKSFCSLRLPLVRAVRKIPFGALLVFLMAYSVLAAHATTATTTTLAISSTSVPYKTPIILTATVTAAGVPVSTGFVLFCDATAPFCENNSALGMVQLTSANATATVKIGSGPTGTHSYKAIYRTNSSYASSTSNTVSYSVQGSYASSTTILSTGSVGNYNLTGDVAGIGSLLTGPGGTVSFLDTSVGNNILGSQTLGPAVLSDNFTQAPNSPFAIGSGGTSLRSVAIASAYLDGDNNLDVVTGDANQTISVLLGNGDGTFKPKINYPGCLSGRALKILLADFNRDGNTDVGLGCSDNTNGGLVILLGNGDGSFQSPVAYASGDAAGLAMGDFNGDGLLDVVITDRLQQNVTIFLGNGDGTFHAGVVALTTPAAAHDVVVGDFNKDGKDDLAYAVNTAVTGSNLADLYVALGNGDGTFQSSVLAASKIGEFLTSGDTNADNITDIVASTITGSTHIGNSMFVLIGKGDGTFKSTVSYVSDIPSDPHLADVNGDGKADIIAGGSYGALVYLGNGDGTFQSYSEPVIGGFALTYAVNAGDYNNDGNADLIGTDASNPQAAVSLSEVRQSADAAALAGVALFPLGSGTHYVDASYSGDSIYLASISSTIPLLAAPTPTTLNLTVSPSSATLVGQSITMTATLDPYAVGPPNTTTDGESVKFFNGATLLGTGTLHSGVATLVTTALPPGNDSLKAVFPGDQNYNASTSSSISVTVASVVLASSLNPSVYGQSVTFTATVPSGETGSVSFREGAVTIGTGTLSGTTTSFTTFGLSGGSHDITAVYSGDSSHSAATSPILTQVVNKLTPTLGLSTSGPSTYGDTVTIVATLPAGTTGTVIFTSGSTQLGTGTVNPAGTVTVVTTTLPAGNDPITATYSGDGNYSGVSASLTQTVAKKTSVTTLTSSVNPSVPGVQVTLTDTLPAGLSGTVSFTSGAAVLGTSSVVSGIATLSISSLPLGSNPITATYSGDSNNNTSVATLNQIVAKLTPVVTVTTSGPSIYSGAVTITVGLSTSATGTVTITSGGLTLGTGSASNTITVVTTALPVGSDVITASYGGDSTNNAATGTATQNVTKASPAVVLTSSVNPSTIGQTVTFTAAVPTNATGTIAFANGATALGTASIANGIATVTASALPIGANSVSATYSGDSNNDTSSATLTQTVNKANPTVMVTTSGPSTYSDAVTITATVPAGATGTITLTSGGATLGSGSIVAGTVAATTTTLPAGSDTITATYSGDSNNNTATGTAVQVVAKATPLGTLTSSLNPSLPGDSVTFTATLSTGVSGTVTFASGATGLGTSAVAGGVASIAASALPIGSDSVTATYSGDSNYNSVISTIVQKVAKTTPTLAVTTSGSSVYGGLVTITATLPYGTTGAVTFMSGATALGTAPITPAGIATIVTLVLPVGTDTITASYSGDNHYNSTTGTVDQIVSKASPSLLLASSVNPANYGQLVTLSATLPANATGSVIFSGDGITLGTSAVLNGVATATTSTLPLGSNSITASYGGDTNNNSSSASLIQTISKGTPTVTVTTSGPSTYGGSVTITTAVPPGISGTVTISSGGIILGSGSVTPAGTVVITTTTLPVGTDMVTASYGGDANNNPATGLTTQTVSKATPIVTVGTSGPSTYGDPVTITATVPPGTTGTVTFTSGGTTVATGVVSPTGTVTITTSTLPVGSDPITVSYNGDGNNNSATGTTIQVVTKVAPAVSLVSSADPSSVSQAVTFTATVPRGVTGSITFFDGATTIGTTAVTNSIAAVTTSALTGGSHTITADYSGDVNHNSATSSPLTQTVNKESPVLPAPSVSSITTTIGSPETISEIVPPGVSGPVSFYDGTTLIGTAPIVGGVATITVSTLPVGSDPITATTPGDANNNPATSPATLVTVAKITPPITLKSSANPSSTGQSLSFTAIVPAAATGTVTFLDGGTMLGTSTLIGGQASLVTSTLTAGSHTITAEYGGDATYDTATSTLNQTVNKGTPTLPAPSVSAPTLASGSPETISETVPAGVSGPVSFYNGPTLIGTATIVNGVATITVTTLPLGTDSISVSTPADPNNNAATSPATSVTVTKLTPLLPPPTVSTTTPTTDTPITISEPVPPGVTGSITFNNGPTVIGTAPIVDGVATITVPSLPVGPNPITAITLGGDNSNPATSPVTPVVVSKATPIVTLASSVNPAEFNQSVTFTATLPAAADGIITFRDGAVILGVSATSGAGIATISTSVLAIGSHTITSAYSGNSNYEAAVSSPLVQVIGKAPTVVVLTQSGSTQLLHNGVAFSATVTSSTPTPTGIVTFLEGTTILGTAPLSTNGNVVVSFARSGDAAYITAALATGSHQITAIYSGDANFAPSTSAPVTNIVQDFTNKVNGVSVQNIFPGDSTTYKFDLAPIGATTFLNDLTLKIDGLPQGTTYTFSPASIAAGSGTTSVVLNIKTSSSLSAGNQSPKNDPASRRNLPIALGVLGLAGLGAVRKHRRKMPRVLMVLLLCLGSLLPIVALSGCAGGYFTLTPTTYSVSVTGTEGSIQHTATTTLIVQ